MFDQVSAQNNPPDDLFEGTDGPDPVSTLPPNLPGMVTPSVQPPSPPPATQTVVPPMQSPAPLVAPPTVVTPPPAPAQAVYSIPSAPRKSSSLLLMVVIFLSVVAIALIGYFSWRLFTSKTETSEDLTPQTLLPPAESVTPTPTPTPTPIVPGDSPACVEDVDCVNVGESRPCETDSCVCQSGACVPVTIPSPNAPDSPNPPVVKDADQDGLTDAQEATYGTSPRNPDTDADGLTDREEVEIWSTDPLNPDSDSDSYQDGEEVKNGYSPLGPGKLFQIPQ